MLTFLLQILFVLLPPFYVSELVKYDKPPNVSADSLVKILTGGVSLQIRDWKLDTDIVQCYAMTETGLITNYEMFNKKYRERYRRDPKCLGYPARGVWYKIVDPDTDQLLGPNQEGELLVKSEFFTNGYYNQPYHEIFDSEGWFRTGDVMYYTEECALYYIDRLKELLRYRQQTMYPYVLESEFLKHPAIAQVVVLGVPSGGDGDHAAAFVVLNPNCGNVTAEEIREFVDEKLQDKAKLRAGVRIVESIPISSTGTVRRRELRRIIMEEKN